MGKKKFNVTGAHKYALKNANLLYIRMKCLIVLQSLDIRIMHCIKLIKYDAKSYKEHCEFKIPSTTVLNNYKKDDKKKK